MNAAYVAAASVAVLAAAIHGIAGERLVLRRLRVQTLHATRYGGPRATLNLLRGSWHLVTATFFMTAVGLAVCAGAEPDGACRGVGLLTAATYGAFFLGVLVRAVRGRPSILVRHPGPAAFALVAGFSWLGA